MTYISARPHDCAYDKSVLYCKHCEDELNERFKSMTSLFERVNEDQVKRESVEHPDHYKGNKFEVIDIIDDYCLNFNLGNVIKYVLRAGRKDDYIQDLKKAQWYIDREIKRVQND